jgi:hypothetical protein
MLEIITVSSTGFTFAMWQFVNTLSVFLQGTHAVAQWLRHCAPNRKVAGSIPDGVIGIFH